MSDDNKKYTKMHTGQILKKCLETNLEEAIKILLEHGGKGTASYCEKLIFSHLVERISKSKNEFDYSLNYIEETSIYAMVEHSIDTIFLRYESSDPSDDIDTTKHLHRLAQFMERKLKLYHKYAKDKKDPYYPKSKSILDMFYETSIISKHKPS
jgi:hypothetical protein